jgi:chromosome segregation ATPase
MAVKGIKEAEKVTLGTIRTLMQTWLAPELRILGERLTHVEAHLETIDRRLEGVDKRLDGVDRRLDGVDKRFDAVDRRFDALEKRIDGVEEKLNSFRTEVRAEFATVHSEIRRLGQVVDFRERLARVEAKLAAQPNRANLEKSGSLPN